MSSSTANSLTTSCHGAALICQRYSACMASLRATARRADAGLMPAPLATATSLLPGALLRREGRQQFDHLERGLHRFSALVHACERRPLLGLRLVLGGQHAEDDRHA